MTDIIKATGVKEPFSEDKLIYSIKRAGIPTNLQDKALAHIKSKLYENMPTSEIYAHIREFLNKEAKPIKSRYGLKQAIMELGPTGYPFEDYVSEILKGQGYTTQVRSIIGGKCVSHEIDVIAEKNSEKLMIEAKFHNTSGTRTDVHVTLYTKARYDDVHEKYKFTKPFIYTNTKITSDALTYALCVDMGVVSWSYPENESLRDLIEKEKLFPLTLIESLSLNQKQTLLDNHIVLIKDICKNPDTLDLLEVQPEKKKTILEEFQIVCGLK
ncbi:MAG TPA: restriction endonuclease [Candidatus Sulfotelmatobacter sp.]|nr:restriction endonuclease [Candidatus Sulfotelmatobacter sp.]